MNKSDIDYYVRIHARWIGIDCYGKNVYKIISNRFNQSYIFTNIKKIVNYLYKYNCMYKPKNFSKNA